MKYIDRLLQGAPVEWRPLGEVAEIYGGLTGKNKDDFKSGDALYIPYKNIFDNICVSPSHLEPVVVVSTEKQNEVRYGDLLFTASSETPEEVGMSSAVTSHFESPVYLNSFCFGVRFNEDVTLIPEFSKFLFRSTQIRRQISRTASGVTRFNVSKSRFKKIEIPIPPVAVQEEVVRILDKFTALEAELKAELDCRRRQYQYYRDALLTFDLSPSDGLCHSPLFSVPFAVEWLPLGEVGEYSQSRIENSELSEDSFIGVDNLLPDRKGKTSSSYVPTKGLSTRYQVGDVLIGNIRPYLKKIYLADNNGGASGDVLVVHVTSDTISPKYLYQVLADDKFFSYNMRYAKGAKMPRGSKDKIMSYSIPIPPLAVQERIVEILDKFDTLVNSISEGLPREIELRRKQYEYCRDALLSF
ncbi:restriction endonuclease subunit S [Porphyromonas sp.]|uniref:restriction endonuclease subunit S n=1 Tax=Porphyromonas sp. TaxID=1924944 RepID=UPI003AB39218